jgi:hypothetical protein
MVGALILNIGRLINNWSDFFRAGQMRVAGCGFFDLGFGISDFGLWTWNDSNQMTEANELGMRNLEKRS